MSRTPPNASRSVAGRVSGPTCARPSERGTSMTRTAETSTAMPHPTYGAGFEICWASPLQAGPSTLAVCQVTALIATTRGSAIGMTAAASSGLNAGCVNDCAHPSTRASAYRGSAWLSPLAASSASANAVADIARSPPSVTNRRSKRSESWPAGIARSTAGTNSARPIRPSVSGSCVRW